LWKVGELPNLSRGFGGVKGKGRQKSVTRVVKKPNTSVKLKRG